MNQINRINSVIENVKKESEELENLYGNDFLNKMREYIYFHKNLNDLSTFENLFTVRKNSFGIKPVFELKDEIKNAENERFKNNSLIATYYFNDPNGPSNRPFRLDITSQEKPIPKYLNDIKHNGHNIRSYVDIELFERIPIENDSKNPKMNDLIEEYLKDGKITITDIDSIESISALQDMEKFHMKFLVFEDNFFIPLYLGVGSNQPYSHANKSGKNGKNRFYRYSMDSRSPFEQKTIITNEKVTLPEESILYEDITSDGNYYYYHQDIGVLIRKNGEYRKVNIEYLLNDLNRNDIFKYKGLDTVEEQINKLYPEYENYIQVHFDPLEKINSSGHEKMIEFLSKHKLLGEGYQNKSNVASDLWINGYDDMYRLKIISLFLLRAMKNDWLNDLIINTSKGMSTQPLEE